MALRELWRSVEMSVLSIFSSPRPLAVLPVMRRESVPHACDVHQPLLSRKKVAIIPPAQESMRVSFSLLRHDAPDPWLPVARLHRDTKTDHPYSDGVAKTGPPLFERDSLLLLQGAPIPEPEAPAMALVARYVQNNPRSHCLQIKTQRCDSLTAFSVV